MTMPSTTGANGMAFDLLGHFVQQIDLVDGRLASRQALHNPPHPTGAFAARRALAAAFMGIEL
jgi:hypothetical protein